MITNRALPQIGAHSQVVLNHPKQSSDPQQSFAVSDWEVGGGETAVINKYPCFFFFQGQRIKQLLICPTQSLCYVLSEVEGYLGIARVVII